MKRPSKSAHKIQVVSIGAAEVLGYRLQVVFRGRQLAQDAQVVFKRMFQRHFVITLLFRVAYVRFSLLRVATRKKLPTRRKER